MLPKIMASLCVCMSLLIKHSIQSNIFFSKSMVCVTTTHFDAAFLLWALFYLMPYQEGPCNNWGCMFSLILHSFHLPVGSIYTDNSNFYFIVILISTLQESLRVYSWRICYTVSVCAWFSLLVRWFTFGSVLIWHVINITVLDNHLFCMVYFPVFFWYYKHSTKVDTQIWRHDRHA